MGPTGNLNGSMRFMCIETGIKLICWNCTPLPMPEMIIKKVEKFAKQDKANIGLRFLDRNKLPFKWDEEDDEVHLLEDEQEQEMGQNMDIPAEMPGVTTKREQPIVKEMPEQDKNKYAAAAKANCKIGKLPMKNLPSLEGGNIEKMQVECKDGIEGDMIKAGQKEQTELIKIIEIENDENEALNNIQD